MERRKFLAIMSAAALAPALAWAGPLEDSIVRQLKGQGYSRIVVSRTLLGRTRFVATSRTHRREIILNPRTGEILRDLLELIGGGRSDDVRILDQEDGQDSSGEDTSETNSGSSSDDDDSDDDSQDDESDDKDEADDKDEKDDSKDDDAEDD